MEGILERGRRFDRCLTPYMPCRSHFQALSGWKHIESGSLTMRRPIALSRAGVALPFITTKQYLLVLAESCDNKKSIFKTYPAQTPLPSHNVTSHPPPTPLRYTHAMSCPPRSHLPFLEGGDHRSGPSGLAENSGGDRNQTRSTSSRVHWSTARSQL